MAHPSRAVHPLLVDLQVPMTERRWAKGQGDAQVHCTGQKEMEGGRKAEAGLVFPCVSHKYHNLQHLCCNCTHICTRLTSLGFSPSYLVAPSSLHQPSLSSCF